MTTTLTQEDKKNALQNSIWNLTNQQAFYGSLLQELVIRFTQEVPLAGITYNTTKHQYEIFINPDTFCSLTNAERVAVFHHEILHFTNKHLFRLPFLSKDIPNEEKKMYNIAGDMAINQYIQNLPKGVVDVAQWKMDDGSLFPTFASMEDYHQLIKDQQKKQEENKKTKGNVGEQLGNFKDFDQHFWDSLDEETKKQMLDEAKKVLKRTLEKTSTSFDNAPQAIKDLLQEIDALAAGINYKQILKNTIKKTVSCVDREGTWRKPNKRYGAYSPGTKMGAMPKLHMYADTSGSISITELNGFLKIINEFLKVGSRNCELGLWHTNLYYKKRYKLNSQLNREDVESGGTTVGCVIEDINKAKPNLAIILTDGYYEDCTMKVTGQVVWIISKGGNQDHPMKHIGKTILLENLT